MSFLPTYLSQLLELQKIMRFTVMIGTEMAENEELAGQ